MSLNWYPWWTQHWRRKTRHLTLAEQGAYRSLIDEYMLSGEALPDNDRAIASLLGCALDEWLAVSAEVRRFFQASNGKLLHKRCEEELHAQRMLGASRSAKARLAAGARWNKVNGIHATRMPGAMLGDATLHKKDIKEAAAGENRLVASPSLLATMKAKGW